MCEDGYMYLVTESCTVNSDQSKLIHGLIFDQHSTLRIAQVTHSRTGRRISHGYNPASIRGNPYWSVAFRIASVIIRSST